MLKCSNSAFNHSSMTNDFQEGFFLSHVRRKQCKENNAKALIRSVTVLHNLISWTLAKQSTILIIKSPFIHLIVYTLSSPPQRLKTFSPPQALNGGLSCSLENFFHRGTGLTGLGFHFLHLPILKFCNWKKQSPWEESFQGRDGTWPWQRERILLPWKGGKRAEIKKAKHEKCEENVT